MNQSHSWLPSISGRFSSAELIESPNPASRDIERKGILELLKSFAEESIDPVSMAIIESIERVCEANDATTSGSHIAPS